MSNIETELVKNYKPWEKYPEESNKANSAFNVYLSLGHGRSLSKTRQELGKSSGYLRVLETWSSKYNWVYRALEYDHHILKQTLSKRQEALDVGYARLLVDLDKAIDVVSEVISLPNSSKLTKEDRSNLTHKLRAAEMILDRVGLVKHKDPIEIDPKKSSSDYIKNIYAKIAEVTKQDS